MADRWFHCCTEKVSFGFAINEQGVIHKIDYPPAKEVVLWKSSKDPVVRQWFIDNIIGDVIEIK